MGYIITISTNMDTFEKNYQEGQKVLEEVTKRI